MNILCRLLIAALPLITTVATAEIRDDASDVRPPLPGMTAPTFEVRDVDGNSVVFDPDDLDKPVILTFYRGGWCPYCNLHLSELRRIEADLRGMGFELWFLSADKPSVLAEGADPEAGYRLLSDARLTAAQAFDIAFRLDDATLAKYAEYGIDLEAASGEDHHALPVPATFLVGTDGVIQFSFVNPDYSVRLSPRVLKAAAEAYVDGAHKRLKRD